MSSNHTLTPRSKPTHCQRLRSHRASLFAIILALIPGLVLWTPSAFANPRGGTVVHGNVSMSGGAGHLQINQGSQRAIINWDSFSIREGETTRFVQPNANAIALNRVVSGNPSAIHGNLRANGGVILVNPNGIVVGPRGTIDINGMVVLSTLDVSNRDFLNGGNMRFTGDSGAGVTNYGAISSANGDVVLLGNFLQNHGSVSAPDGTVAFGAGGDIIVGQTVGGGRISVVAGGRGGGTGIDNTGEVNAAAAEFKAHGNVYALAIRNDGIVRANGYNFSGGKLTLKAGPRGSVVNTGQLVARNRDGSGGRVEISGRQVALAGGSIDASGEPGRAGGSVIVEAEGVSVGAEARIEVGGSTGGRVRISGSGGTDLAGSIDAVGSSGQGGRVDVTGAAVRVAESARIDASGLSGGAVRVGGGISGADPDIENANTVRMLGGSKIFADGSEGDGGSVVVFAEGSTLFEGEISAQAFGSVGNGGFVEVSGQRDLSLDGSVSTLAANGSTGTFLIDPVDVVIFGPNGGGTLSDAALRGFVGANNVIIHTSGGDTGAGNITVNSGAKVVYDSPNSLTFLAHGSIFVNGDIKNIGSTDIGNTGHITLAAGWDGTLPLVLDDNVSAADFINLDGTPLETHGRFGSWGASGSQVFLNQAGLEAVEVGSARGETNVFADVVTMRHGRGTGRFTQIGYRRVADRRANDPGGAGGFFENPDDQIVDGHINVSGLSAVRLLPSDEFNAADLNKIRTRAYVQIGHGGMRRNTNDIANMAGTAYGYDSGVINVADGDNSGDITVYAGLLLDMMGSRLQGHTMIGHGGLGGQDSSPAWDTHVHTPFQNQIIRGDMSGDIRVTAGMIQMEAGLLSDNPVQIGHGGRLVRGEHSGEIQVTSTVGGIRGTAAPALGEGPDGNVDEWRWRNNRDRSYVQIGHGGSSSFHPDALPVRNLSGLGTGGTGTGNTSYAGDGITINPETGLPYGHSGAISVISAGGIHFTSSGNNAHAMIGHGGDTTHGDHRGDIHVEARGGDLIFDRIVMQLDRHGRDRRNVGTGAFNQIGHGGRRSVGGHTGDIYVSSTGNIEFHAGRNEAFAMIGHGGRGLADSATVGGVGSQRNANHAAGSHTGDITVLAGGDIKFRAGFGAASVTAFAMIGHGGYRQYADILENAQFPGVTPYGGGASRILTDANGDPIFDVNGLYQLVPDETQQGHNGDIVVTAGGNIDFRAGQVEGEILPGQEPFGTEQNGRLNFVMIGHGGDESFGEHWGNIDITAGGDLIFEARGGWDGVSIFSTNSTGLPRLGQQEDNSTSGNRNFAFIGNGGYNTGHRIVANNPAHVSGSGKQSEGMGVWGPSDITINVGGDIELIAAQEATVGPMLPVGLQIRASGTSLYYLDGEGVALEQFLADNPNHPDFFTLQNDLFDMRIDLRDVAPEDGLTMSQHSARLHWLARADGELWVLPDPVMGSTDGFAQIGNGGRSTNYLNGEDTLGHRGNITINAGGGITALASDIGIRVGAGQSVEVLSYANGYNPEGDFTYTFQVGPATPDDDLTGVTQTSGTHQRSPSQGNRNYVQIGLGGWQARGDHLGDIRIVAGQTAGGVGLRLVAGEGQYDYAQIGNGGFQAGGYSPLGVLNSTEALDGDTGDTGNIHVEVDGDIVVQSGGNLRVPGMTATDTGTGNGTIPLHTHNLGSDARIGNGGHENRATHSGDITVISHQGGLDLLAGAARRAAAQIGHGGYDARAVDHNGDIVVVAKGDINIRGAVPFVDPVSGQISVTKRSNAHIGHGGYASNARSGNAINAVGFGGFHGDIEVISVDGSVRLQGGGDPTLTTNTDGFSQSLYTQIGHGGGVSTHGDHRGDIRVVAGQDVVIMGGAGGRDSYTQIGHAGGPQNQGNLSGDIEVVAGGDLVMNRGADTDTGSGDREGAQLFNNWAKIGHGNHRRGQRNDGQGDFDGDIHISLGGSAYLSLPENRPFADAAYTRPFADQILIGHVDSRVSNSDPMRAASGDTFIAVGRRDPFNSASGSFVTGSEATIASAGEGLFGELRFYLPSSASNWIADGTMINSTNYSRIPDPGSNRADEQIATEHLFGTGAYGELSAEFTPEGAYPTQPFGLYNVYYAGAAPIVDIPLPPELPPVLDLPPPVIPGFDFLGFDGPSLYDAFDRYAVLLGYDGYEGMLFSIALDDAILEDEEALMTRGWFLEDLLAVRNGGNDPASAAEAEDDWRRRKLDQQRDAANRKVGMVPMTYYLFDPGTNRYSSFHVFGVPRGRLPAAQPQ